MRIDSYTPNPVLSSSLPALPAASTDFAARLAQAGAAGDDEKLQTVCREFEAVLLKEILTRMRATVGKSGLFDGGQQEEIYRDMLDDTLAQALSRGQGIGLAAQMYAQLKNQ